MDDHTAHILIAKVTALETQMNHLQDTLVPKVKKLEELYVKHHHVLARLAELSKRQQAKVVTLEEDLANVRIVVPDLPPLDDEKMPPWEGCGKVKEEKVEPMS